MRLHHQRLRQARFTQRYAYSEPSLKPSLRATSTRLIVSLSLVSIGGRAGNTPYVIPVGDGSKNRGYRRLRMARTSEPIIRIVMVLPSRDLDASPLVGSRETAKRTMIYNLTTKVVNSQQFCDKLHRLIGDTHAIITSTVPALLRTPWWLLPGVSPETKARRAPR
jgi:hypothetical protein